MERKYSVAEIDLMRDAVRKEIGYPSVISRSSTLGGGYSELTPGSLAALDSFNRAVEDKLRTYMLAGVDPQEFETGTQEATRTAS